MKQTMIVPLLCLLIHSTAGALRLSLVENDFSASESKGTVQVIVSSLGWLEEEVTIELIPLSVEEYGSVRTCHWFLEESTNIDYATPGLDFNATIQTAVVQSGRTSGTELVFNIDIVDDTISERQEAFFIYLHVLDNSSNIVVERDCSKVVIREDFADASKTVIQFSTHFLEVNEGVGVVNDSLFITVLGEAEPMLQVDLILVHTGKDDVQLFSSKLNISSGDRSIPVPFSVSDDFIHERLECFIVQLVKATDNKDKGLYMIGFNHTVKLCIEDNDVAKIGFDMSESPKGSPLVIKEGQTRQVCVSVFEPEQLDRFMELTIILLGPATPGALANSTQSVIVKSDLMFYFDNTVRHHCIQLSVREDKLITPSWSFLLSLSTTYAETGSTILLEPNILSLTIIDNHGVPFAPYDIKAQLTSDAKNVLVTWQIQSTILKPIDQFAVELHTIQSHSRVARQQDNNMVQTFWTSSNEFLVEGIDQHSEYVIRVCAENLLGEMCSDTFSLRGDDILGVHTESEGVLSPGNSRPLVSYVDKHYLYIIIAVTLFLVSALLLGGVCVCVGHRMRKKQYYYPSKQENKMNRIVEIRRYVHPISSMHNL